MSASNPQKMLVAEFDRPVYRGCHSSFTPLARRCDDSKTLLFDRRLWARFRFSVVGSLLSSPPARRALGRALRSLAEKTWSHPVTGRDFRVAAGTIACWYYMALRQPDDPVGAFRAPWSSDTHLPRVFRHPSSPGLQTPIFPVRPGSSDTHLPRETSRSSDTHLPRETSRSSDTHLPRVFRHPSSP